MRRYGPRGATSPEFIEANRQKWAKVKAEKKKLQEKERLKEKALREREKRLLKLKLRRKPVPPLQFPRIPLPPDQVLAEAHLEGATYRALALHYNCSPSTIYCCVKRHMLKLNNQRTDYQTVRRKGNSPKMHELRKMIKDARRT